MSIKVTVEASYALKKLAAIKKKYPKETGNIVQEVALNIEREAKLRAPVKTGTLRNSIHIVRKNKNAYSVEDGVTYGIYNEMRKPFMRPAAIEVGSKINTIINRAFKRTFGK